MASKASVRVAQPVIPSPSVAAGTMSPRSSPGGMHLNATKSLVSAVQELKAATSAVKQLSAAAEKISPTTSAAGDVTKKVSRITEGSDSGLGSTKKSSAGLVAKFAEDDTHANKSPAGSAAKIAIDTATPGSPVKSPTAATLASEVARTLSVTRTAEEAAVPSKASLSAVGAAPLIPVPSLAAGTIQTRPSATTNATTELLSRKKSSSSASSSSSETRRKKKAEDGEKKMSEEAASATVRDASVTSAAAGSKSELNPATVIPGSTVNMLAVGSVVAGSKAALGSKQNLQTSTPGSNANIPPTGSLFTGSKALLGSKQNVQTGAEEETEPEVEITSSPLTTEVRPLPDEYATADTSPTRKL